MKITKNDEVRSEILKMTRDMITAQDRNNKINDCVGRRLMVPLDNPQLYAACRKMGDVIMASPEKIMPLMLIARSLGLDGGAFTQFMMTELPYMTVYKAQDIMDNPYYQKIKIDDVKVGSYVFVDTMIKRGEVFLDTEPRALGYQRHICMGLFDDRDLHYPSFNEDDRCWMSITPNEIVTMKDDIANASGKVLTLGLGLGYYAYMVHIKEDVESITIIEYEQEVIDMFTEHILPQFDHPEKVHIIQGDAIKYLAELEDGVYDYCFADIWQNPEDGLRDYLQLKHHGNRFEKMTCTYWIEESFVGYLEGSLANVIQYAFLGEYDGDMMRNKGYATMKALTKEAVIDKPEDVKHMFGGKYVRELLSAY